MSSDLTAQLELTASAEGVETGIGRAKKSLASLAVPPDAKKPKGPGRGAGRDPLAEGKRYLESLQKQLRTTEDLSGTVDWRAQNQIAMQAGRAIQVAMGRSG